MYVSGVCKTLARNEQYVVLVYIYINKHTRIHIYNRYRYVHIFTYLMYTIHHVRVLAQFKYNYGQNTYTYIHNYIHMYACILNRQLTRHHKHQHYHRQRSKRCCLNIKRAKQSHNHSSNFSTTNKEFIQRKRRKEKKIKQNKEKLSKSPYCIS